MKHVLLRQSVFRGASRTYHELELEVSRVVVGSEATSTIILQGAGIEPRHAVIEESRKGVLQARSSGKHSISLNGENVGEAALAEGDAVDIAGNVITVLPAPPGFDLALQVDVAGAEAYSTREAQYRTDIRQLRISKRAFAWALALLALIFSLALPLLSSLFDREGEAPLVPAALSDRLWSTGHLHPAHALAIGDDCQACHAQPFVRVRDEACTHCHEGVDDHVPAEAVVNSGGGTERCGSCHREHGEVLQYFVDSSGADCASCHDINSLAQDHPEFVDYPNPERPNIIFDHAAHDAKHFPKTGREFQCVGCHQMDPAGQHQVISSFENMCINCHGPEGGGKPSTVFHHGDQIASADPVVVFHLPALDLRTLASVPRLGSWPEGTRKGVRSGLSRLGLSPFVELLLSTDPKAGPALSELKKSDLKLKSLKAASDEELGYVVEVAWGVKLLMDELDFYPAKDVIRNRLGSIVGREMTERELATLGGQLPAGVVDSAVDLWFRGVAGEDLALSADIQRSGRVPVKHPRNLPDATAAELPGTPGVRTGPWSEEKYALFYRPSGHQDDFVRAWLDLSIELMQMLEPSPQGGFGPPEAAAALFDELADGSSDPGKARGAGRCTKCHSQIQGVAGQISLAWASRRGDPLRNMYTRFMHADHLGDRLGAEEICEDCHQRTMESNILSAYEPGASESAFSSNYQPLQVAQCTECHAPGQQASDSCLSCHNYHVVAHPERGEVDLPQTGHSVPSDPD